MWEKHSVSIAMITAFGLVSLMFVVSPGADWAYAISAGISFRSPIPAVMGILTGHFLATLVVAIGVGVWISHVPIVMLMLTLTGASYLIWIGFSMLRNPSTVSAFTETAVPTIQRQYLGGVAVSGLNPKLMLLFLALMPQFIDTSGRWSTGMQMLTLGSVHVLNCTVVYLIVAFASLHLLRSRPSVAKTVSRISGGALVVIGLVLIVEQVL